MNIPPSAFCEILYSRGGVYNLKPLTELYLPKKILRLLEDSVERFFCLKFPEDCSEVSHSAKI